MKEILNTIQRVVDLLVECEMKANADWLLARFDQIKKNLKNKSVVDKALREIQGVLAGMGSLSDLSLVPIKKSKLTQAEVRELQWALVKQMDSQIRTHFVASRLRGSSKQ